MMRPSTVAHPGIVSPHLVLVDGVPTIDAHDLPAKILFAKRQRVLQIVVALSKHEQLLSNVVPLRKCRVDFRKQRFHFRYGTFPGQRHAGPLLGGFREIEPRVAVVFEEVCWYNAVHRVIIFAGPQINFYMADKNFDGAVSYVEFSQT